MHRRILIAYYSRTGDVGTLAEALRQGLQPAGEVHMARVEPRAARGYWRWLSLSFIPGSKVKIRPMITDCSSYDLVCLGFPKWTLSCPPVNEYLRLMTGAGGKRMVLFMSYGGFDHERYLRHMTDRAARSGAAVRLAASFRRRSIRDGSFSGEMEGCCETILELLQRRDEGSTESAPGR